MHIFLVHIFCFVTGRIMLLLAGFICILNIFIGFSIEKGSDRGKKAI